MIGEFLDQEGIRAHELQAGRAVLEDQGAWEKVDARMQDLLRVFTDPEEEEYHVIRAEYERLLERIAYEQRKAKERR